MLRDRERVRALLLGNSSPHRICARCGPCRIRSGHDSGNEGPGPCKKLGEIHCPDCPGKLALAAKQDQARVSHHLESPGEVGKRRAVDSCEPCIWLELRCRRLESNWRAPLSPDQAARNTARTAMSLGRTCL